MLNNTYRRPWPVPPLPRAWVHGALHTIARFLRLAVQVGNVACEGAFVADDGAMPLTAIAYGVALRPMSFQPHTRWQKQSKKENKGRQVCLWSIDQASFGIKADPIHARLST